MGNKIYSEYLAFFINYRKDESMTIKIRNYNLPKNPRVFDVTVNDKGEIINYQMQNIKGCICVGADEVNRQIKEAISKKAK